MSSKRVKFLLFCLWLVELKHHTRFFLSCSQPISLCVALRPWPTSWSWWTALGASAGSTSDWCECSWRTWWEPSTSASTRPEWVSDWQLLSFFERTSIQLSANLTTSCVTVVFPGLAQYSGDPRIEWHLNSFSTKDAVLDAVRNLPYKGGNTLTGT